MRRYCRRDHPRCRLMVEVGPWRFVNARSALRLGLVQRWRSRRTNPELSFRSRPPANLQLPATADVPAPAAQLSLPIFLKLSN